MLGQLGAAQEQNNRANMAQQQASFYEIIGSLNALLGPEYASALSVQRGSLPVKSETPQVTVETVQRLPRVITLEPEE